MQAKNSFSRGMLVATAAVGLSACPYPYYGGGNSGSGGSGGCEISLECDDLEFCNAGECDEGLDRRYRVTITTGEAATSGTPAPDRALTLTTC